MAMRGTSRAKAEYVLGIRPEQISEALASGVDQRSIDSYVAEQTKRVDDVMNTSGLMRAFHIDQLVERRIPELARASLDTEIKKQPGLQAIKQKRKSLIGLEAKTLTKKTGRRALLTSPAGGSGFYGGYFNGK
jgi:hypothetical protein